MEEDVRFRELHAAHARRERLHVDELPLVGQHVLNAGVIPRHPAVAAP